jgi:DMSO/TMAO reductase YedYZ molybdopterin-dependent catalytic subunit/thiosulfate reductase cytochrome b subunit
MPEARGVSPRIRIGRDKWLNLLWLLPVGFVLLLICVAAAQGLRHVPAVERFITRYPGTIVASSDSASTGLPLWVDVTHFLNLLLMVFIIRSGIQILADHPRLYWTRHSTPGKDWFRFQRPVPLDPLWTAKQDSVTLPQHVGLPGLRHSIGLARWWHLGTDVLWLANGVAFYVLLFTTGQWRRVVPTTWTVMPAAASVLIQYLSLAWPRENGWIAYNALQQLAYFITIFIAAPAAMLTGLGMSPALSTRFRRVSRLLNIQVARSLHFLILCWFLLFILLHTALVFTTGLLRNLNMGYAARDSGSWLGFGVFAASMVVVTVAWVAATPVTLRRPRSVQRVGFALIGPVQRLFEHVDTKPGEYSEQDISPYFWHNGAYPRSEEYRTLYDSAFAGYRLRITGLVERPVELTLDQIRALPYHQQITQHFCIQGWSGVAKWGGTSMGTILDLVRPKPEAQWVVFYSLGDGADGGLYYDAHPIEQMRNELTMLACDMDGEPLTYGHGAPLRLRNEVQLGFKQVKWIAAIEFVADFTDVGAGYGGYDEDHEFFGYRQSI